MMTLASRRRLYYLLAVPPLVGLVALAALLVWLR